MGELIYVDIIHIRWNRYKDIIIQLIYLFVNDVTQLTSLLIVDCTNIRRVFNTVRN